MVVSALLKSALTLFTLAGALASGLLAAEMLRGKIVSVADGDTVTVLDSTNTQHKVRLAGIDAPEKGMPFGNTAKRHLSNLVAGRFVKVDAGRQTDMGDELARSSFRAKTPI